MTWVRFQRLKDSMGKILRAENQKPRSDEDEIMDAREGRDPSITDHDPLYQPCR